MAAMRDAYLATIRDPLRRARVRATLERADARNAAREADIAVIRSLATQVADEAWRLGKATVPQQTVDGFKTRLHDMLWQLGVRED